jgi:hypothetical protein
MQTRVGAGSSLGSVKWGSAADENKIYVAVSDTKFTVVPVGTRGAQTSPFDCGRARSGRGRWYALR